MRAGETVFYDRCALDALAHAVVAHEGGNQAFTSDWMEELRNETEDTMKMLDLVVVVPLGNELPLESDGVRSTDEAYRQAVDEAIQRLGATTGNTLLVSGTREDRVRQVLQALEPGDRSGTGSDVQSRTDSRSS